MTGDVAKDMEIELKLRFEGYSVWDAMTEDTLLQDIPAQGPWTLEELETIYFDTKEQTLCKIGYAYRIRRQGNGWIATIKGMGSAEGGLHQREEWSCPVQDPVPDLAPFASTKAGVTLKDIVTKETLMELFRTRFTRKFRVFLLPKNTVVELAADWGAIIKGEEQLPISEIELELKKGNVGELLSLGAALSEKYDLRPEFNSKYHRGLILAGALSEVSNSTATNSPETGKEEPLDQIQYIHKALHIQEKLFQEPGNNLYSRELTLLLAKLGLPALINRQENFTSLLLEKWASILEES